MNAVSTVPRFSLDRLPNQWGVSSSDSYLPHVFETCFKLVIFLSICVFCMLFGSHLATTLTKKLRGHVVC